MSTRKPSRPASGPSAAPAAPTAPTHTAGHAGDRSIALALDTTAAAPPLPAEVGAGLRHLGRLSPGTARDVRAAPTPVPPDALVRVTYSDGSTWWRRADELIRDSARPTAARGAAGAAPLWEIDPRRDPLLDDAGAPGTPGARGVVSTVMQVLDFFGFDASRPVAGLAGKVLEEQRLGRPEGLYRVGLDADASGLPVLTALPAGHRIKSGQPVLVFLHGTFSSTPGSFGALWNERDQPLGRALRADLARVYGDEVYAFEHRSLTHSPVRNALDLSRHLPADAELHLVSHSRGGLVGELLCLGQRTRSQDPLTDPLADSAITRHFRTQPAAAAALRLGDLGTAEQRERQQALDADLALLRQLRDALAGVRVTRFARVACPAAGTSLASGRLDRWLNLMLMVLPDGLATGLTEFLLAVLQHRTDPRTLPGLEAMMPGSALTQLLRADGLVTDADLTAITGDIDPARRADAGVRFKLARQLATRIADRLFEGEHDFVVNTPSMTGGLRRKPGRARVRADQGLDVDHFRYFRNAASFTALRDALFAPDPNRQGTPLYADVPQAARALRSAPRSRDAANAADQRRPIVVLIPGTMGSELHANGEVIWLHYNRLARGQLDRIAVDSGEAVTPTALIADFYGPLAEHLARTHEVHLLPYDWRQSVTVAAGRLRDLLRELLPLAQQRRQPIQIVAHSMGGLVARALIADATEGGAAVWRQVIEHPQARLLMLGTPNRGSHEAVRWLTGFNPTQAKLSVLDLTRTPLGLIEIVQQFPGLLELLPSADPRRDWADLATWRKLKAECGQGWRLTDAALLGAARQTWQKLDGQAIDPQRMLYVAGCQPKTVCDLDIDFDPGRPEFPPQIAWQASAEGDGTVLWDSGRLAGVPMYYAPDTAHDELCSNTDDARIFRGYVELLLHGKTDQLSTQPPAGASRGVNGGVGGTAGGSSATFPLGDPPVLDTVPDADSTRALGLGGASRRRRKGATRPAVAQIEVSIKHGNLAFARHPVLVGHYQGDTIVSAEKALDARLGGELTRRQALGLYPGPIGSHAVFHNRPQRSPTQALVLGLGPVGTLSPGLLEAGVRDLLLDLALRRLQPGGDAAADGAAPPADGTPPGPRRIAISSLLVGTGAGALKPREAIEAILRGAVAANHKLQAAALDDQVLVDRIEFLELYEDIALGAAGALAELLRSGDLAQQLRWAQPEVQAGDGRRQRRRFDEDPGWWQRLEIVADDSGNQLRFIATTDRARAEETLSQGQLSLADQFVARASATTTRDADVAKTLFEMLLPQRLKEAAPEQRDRVLVVDAQSARFPWELLEDRWSQNGLPVAVASGLVRQLKTVNFRARPVHTAERSVFVVGDPDLADWAEVAQLPGARDEADAVDALLRERGFQSSACINANAQAILTGLHSAPWRVLHLAGHGVHEYEVAGRRYSGMVIGHQTFLTPGDIGQLRHVPELVFINCCHLGQTRSTGLGEDLNRLAANLGVGFIEMGVKCVIAAGWAVDDAAALVFARSFYDQLLNGATFGVAVRVARADTYRQHPESNTWGAYQCYGDPSYRLSTESPAVGPKVGARFYAPAELIAELDNLRETLRADAREPGGRPADTTLAPQIEALTARVSAALRPGWLARADVAAALGFLWGEVGDFAQAITWLDRALAAPDGDCPIRAAEQGANFRVRLAASTWQAGRTQARTTPVSPAREPDAEPTAATRSARKTIEDALYELDVVCRRAPTVERLNLLASACKRLAWVSADDAAACHEALVNLRGYSQSALDLHAQQRGGAVKLYSYTNWALAGLLLDGPDAAPDRGWRAELDARCDAGIVQAREEDAAAPSVWGASTQADMALVQLLHAGPRDATRRADRTRYAAEHYGRAFARAASERERGSVLENLDFLVELMTPTWPAATLDALQQLRGSL